MSGCGQPTDCGCGGLSQASDQGQLPGLLEAVQEEYGHIPTRVGPVADFRRGLNLHHPECTEALAAELPWAGAGPAPALGTGLAEPDGQLGIQDIQPRACGNGNNPLAG